MTDTAQLQDLIGRTAVDQDGQKIGKIGAIYLDDRTGEPQWVTVSTGLFGTKESFAPLAGHTDTGGDIQLNVTKDQVKDAPTIDPDGHLEDSENDALYSHYGVSASSSDTNSGTGDGYANVAPDTAAAGGRTNTNEYDTQGHHVAGPTTDDAMTRSEERLRVGTEQVESGRARLRKYVVTENVQTTVPVSHEEVRVDREPITDANRDAALSGEPITEEEHEVTLHAEQPVVDKEAVPVERVRLSADTVTENRTVEEQVRKEQIDEPTTDGHS